LRRPGWHCWTRHSTIRNLTFLTGTIAVLDIDARVTGFTSLLAAPALLALIGAVACNHLSLTH
jgi:hypothetical protein